MNSITTGKTMNTTKAFYFATSEDGAVTVDWVVLTAGLVGLGLAAMAVTSAGVENLSGDIRGELTSMDAGQPFGLAAWAAGAPLYFSQADWDSNRDFFATRDAATNTFGATEALALAANDGRSDRLYQLDQAGANIAALAANGEDVSALQAQYDALYAELSSST
jgi:hypothetical protein